MHVSMYCKVSSIWQGDMMSLSPAGYAKPYCDEVSIGRLGLEPGDSVL